MVLKGLSKDYDHKSTVLNFGAPKPYDKTKQDLINFESTRCLSTGKESTAAFHVTDKKRVACLKCGRTGHMARECRGRETRTSFNCGTKGHLASKCRTPRKKGSIDVAGASGNARTAGFFSLESFDALDEQCCELIVDSGCNGFMIKDKELFVELDENFKSDVGNANSSRFFFSRTRDSTMWSHQQERMQCELELRDAYWVPSYAKNLISVKRRTDEGGTVKFELFLI